MSSNIIIQRICQYCGKEFTARTTSTQYCTLECNRKAYKAKQRAVKIEQSNSETQQKRNQPNEELKAKEFLTVREVASLLNCSVRSVYYYIETGTIKAVNLGQRITRVKRSEIDKLFEQPQPETPQPEQKQIDISECYTTEQVRSKYNISVSGLRNLIIKHEIPKIRKGWFAYVPKSSIDKILS